MSEAAKSGWVRWSQYTDTEDRPMVMIGGGHYPQPLAEQIARDILALLGKDEYIVPAKENPNG